MFAPTNMGGEADLESEEAGTQERSGFFAVRFFSVRKRDRQKLLRGSFHPWRIGVQSTVKPPVAVPTDT